MKRIFLLLWDSQTAERDTRQWIDKGTLLKLRFCENFGPEEKKKTSDYEEETEVEAK